MPTNYTRVMRAFAAHPWAILPSKLDAICGVIEAKVNGASASKDEIRAMFAATPAGGSTLQGAGSIAVVPLRGVIAHRMNMFTDFSGGTSLEQFRDQFTRAVQDPAVKAIIIDCDSPGGSTYGVMETADVIMAARDAKPIVLQVNPLMASAALWIGAAASEVVITPSGDAGSLGVYMVVEDWSKANEEHGVKVEYIVSDLSPRKIDGHPDIPMTDEARARFQRDVNVVAEQFAKAVAKARGLSVDHVKEHFGQGGTLMAKEAKAAGMVDRVATMDETIERLASKRGRSAVSVGAQESAGSFHAAGAEPVFIAASEPVLNIRHTEFVVFDEAQADSAPAEAPAEAPFDVATARARLALEEAEAEAGVA